MFRGTDSHLQDTSHIQIECEEYFTDDLSIQQKYSSNSIWMRKIFYNIMSIWQNIFMALNNVMWSPPNHIPIKYFGPIKRKHHLRPIYIAVDFKVAQCWDVSASHMIADFAKGPPAASAQRVRQCEGRLKAYARFDQQRVFGSEKVSSKNIPSRLKIWKLWPNLFDAPPLVPYSMKVIAPAIFGTIRRHLRLW